MSDLSSPLSIPKATVRCRACADGRAKGLHIGSAVTATTGAFCTQNGTGTAIVVATGDCTGPNASCAGTQGLAGLLSAAFVRLVLLRWGVHLAVSLAAEAALDHGQHDGSILRIVKEPRPMHAAYASLSHLDHHQALGDEPGTSGRP